MEKNVLTGAVHTIIHEISEISRRGDQYVEGSRRLSRREVYDKHGNILEEVTYSINNSIARRRVFFYDEQGHLIEEAEYDAAGALVCKLAYNHGTETTTAEEINYVADAASHMLSGTYTYDKKGNRVRLAMRKAGGASVSQLDSAHDSEGNLLESTFRTSDGTAIGRSVVNRSADGRQIEVSTFYTGNLLVSKIIFSFDEMSNQIEVARYNADGTLHSKSSYDYIFDSHGNWVKRTELNWAGTTDDPEPTEVVYRAVTYYENHDLD